MAGLRIAEDGRRFVRDGVPFFWLGDTVWSAFTNATEEEWAEYLAVRREQGFNVLQINTLPQWDRIGPDLGLTPYPVRDGALDYTAEPDPAWITHSQRLCAMAVEAGFVLALVVDWCDMVPDTWLSRIFPHHVWPMAAMETHVRRVAAWYGALEPVYIVSGDTDFGSEETQRYYSRAMDILREAAPEALLTMHLAGELTDIPAALARRLDFLMYQSGHHSLDKLETLPARMLAKYPGKPLLNAEPCYEGMPVFGGSWSEPPREVFTAGQVLEACRRSIAAGADAGITYGANGVWNWRRSADQFTGPGMYANTPTWREALHLPAAARIAALRPDNR